LLGSLIKKEVKLESLRDAEETNNLSAVGPPPPIISKRPSQETMPDMPAAPRPGRRISSESLSRRGEIPLADEAESGKVTIPDSASYMLPDIDDETSLELRSFARMLAEAENMNNLETLVISHNASITRKGFRALASSKTLPEVVSQKFHKQKH